MSEDESTREAESAHDEQAAREETLRQCPDTGRKQGLVGTYDIWLCRQSFREKARDIGFKKYD